VGFNGSRLWPGCNKPEISRPARRTPHETITTQNKILINRAKKVIAYSAIRVGIYLRANDDERIPIGVGGKTTTANSQELTKGRGEPSVCKVKRARQTKRCNFSELRGQPAERRSAKWPEKKH
jgi:hypothetical protein